LITTPLPKVVGYIRGSTLEQQNTLEAQEKQIRAYCDYRGLELVRCFTDSGESAFSVSFYERPAAAEMLAWARENGVSGIVFPKLDRGFRDALDCLFTCDDLNRKGVQLHILDIQLDTTTPVGKLVLTMMAAIAEFENRRRSERQQAGFEVMKANGQRCGSVPYGWTAVPAGRKSKTGRDAEDLVPNPGEQIVLRRVVMGDLSAMADNAAARLLNFEGVPAKKGGKWHGSAVRAVRKAARLDSAEEAA
jgi:DNA invertase Pin-like site-specific DNA recombinase